MSLRSARITASLVLSGGLQTHLTTPAYCRLSRLPLGFIQLSVLGAGSAQPLLVCAAVASVGIAALAGAGGDRTAQVGGFAGARNSSESATNITA
jgi:hypothetical protein